MGKKGHRKHHYIPQCYLRNFSSNGKSLWTYDKLNSKIYSSAIDNICCIDEFYTLPEGCVNKYNDERKNQLFVECDFFAENIESQYDYMLQKIISNKDKWIGNPEQLAITNEEKLLFAKHIAIQWMRTPSQREKLLKMNYDIISQEMEIFKAFFAYTENNPEYLKTDIKFETNAPLLHAQMIFDNHELISSFAEAICSNYWEFSVSEIGDIYTSDYPIVVEPHVQGAPQFYDGLASYGSESSFPISKNIVLTIWDKEYFTDKSGLDCKFVMLDEKEKRRKNLHRYFYARRHLYCSENCFVIIEREKYLNEGSHIFMGNSKK